MKYRNYLEFDTAKQKCRDCYVGRIYNCVVPSDGNKVSPTILIIGEAAGSRELEILKPFVGKAGKLLRSTLNQFGFNESNSLITNTIPCRPENNKFPKDRKIVNSCVERWLRQEIILTNPKYIILVGATPTKYLLGLSGITKLRGQWFTLPNFDRNIQCMPIYHPSYVNRKKYMAEGKQIEADFINDIKEVAKYLV
jgi:DNA polymerase